jgi:hypothetical protein
MSDDKNLYMSLGHFTQHSLKHIISFSHTDLRNSPSANFLIIPFEIFQEHTLRTLFTLPFRQKRI